MNAPYEIVGFTTDDFVPGFVSDVIFGAAGLSAASATLKLLIVANSTSAGDATPGVEVQIFSPSEADARAGAGSEGARMCRAALKIPGVAIWFCAVADPAGTAASMTVTFANNADSAGEILYWINGVRIAIEIDSGDTPTVTAGKLVSAINALPNLPCTAANVAGVVTATMKQTGPRGNDCIVRQDTTNGPSAQTSTLAGTAVTGLGVKFAGGATADDLTTAATNTYPSWYARVALAARDATQLGVWESSMDAKAGPFEQRPQHTVCAVNGSLSAAQSLSQTTLNNARFQLLWMLNSETDPAELAAFFAALRAVTEQSDPNHSYSGEEVSVAAPHTLSADSPQRSTQVAALKTGVTPLKTENGVVSVVRSITTRCLSGSNPDYNTLDTGTAYVPDFVRYALGLRWFEFKKVNPDVADDPAPEEPPRASGVATPTSWNAAMFQLLKELEGAPGVPLYSGLARGQIVDVDLPANKPSTRYDRAAKRLMSACPVVPAPKNEQVGVTVLQY